LSTTPVERIDSSVSSGSGEWNSVIAATPAWCRSHSILASAASRTRSVASVMSGPMPSPGISVTLLLISLTTPSFRDVFRTVLVLRVLLAPLDEVFQPARPLRSLLQRRAEQVERATPCHVVQRITREKRPRHFLAVGRHRDRADGRDTTPRLEQFLRRRREDVDVRSDPRPQRPSPLELSPVLRDTNLHDVAAQRDVGVDALPRIELRHILRGGQGQVLTLRQDTVACCDCQKKKRRTPAAHHAPIHRTSLPVPNAPFRRAMRTRPQGSSVCAITRASDAATSPEPSSPGSPAITPYHSRCPPEVSISASAAGARPASGRGTKPTAAGTSARRASSSPASRRRSPSSGSPMFFTCAT